MSLSLTACLWNFLFDPLLFRNLPGSQQVLPFPTVLEIPISDDLLYLYVFLSWTEPLEIFHRLPPMERTTDVVPFHIVFLCFLLFVVFLQLLKFINGLQLFFLRLFSCVNQLFDFTFKWVFLSFNYWLQRADFPFKRLLKTVNLFLKLFRIFPALLHGGLVVVRLHLPLLIITLLTLKCVRGNLPIHWCVSSTLLSRGFIALFSLKSGCSFRNWLILVLEFLLRLILVLEFLLCLLPFLSLVLFGFDSLLPSFLLCLQKLISTIKLILLLFLCLILLSLDLKSHLFPLPGKTLFNFYIFFLCQLFSSSLTRLYLLNLLVKFVLVCHFCIFRLLPSYRVDVHELVHRSGDACFILRQGRRLLDQRWLIAVINVTAKLWPILEVLRRVRLVELRWWVRVVRLLE